MDLVQEVWNMQVQGNAMWRLQCKLKALSKRLSQWSRNIIGDINEHVSSWEAKVHILEELDILHNSEHDRTKLNKGHTEYIKWLGMQESLLKKKTKLNWFQQGDYNNKYFHSVLRERRRKLGIHRIKNHGGRWIQGDDKIARVAIKHFEQLFNLSQTLMNPTLLDCILFIVTSQDNEMLTNLPNEIEMREVVFSMSRYSCAGTDEYNGKFFQACWSIIKTDIVDFVLEFFSGKKLTKFYMHTCLALIPKVDSPDSFTDNRPISLSNVTNKIISKVLSRRLNPLLPNLISDNQSGFIIGRLITENFMMAQEIVQGISKINVGGNIILKLDMVKAYDRMSWPFITDVLKKFGFNGKWIQIIENLIS